jgi:RND family efflux transporter MFP subunit
MKKIIIPVTVLLTLALIFFQLFRNKKELDAAKVAVDRSSAPVSVATAPATLSPVKDSFSIPATLYPYDQADISAASSGRIMHLNLELGAFVTRGQVVGVLDTRETDQKLKADSLSLEKLQRVYERNKILVAGNATNANALIDSKYDVDSKKLDIQQLQTQLSNARIVAPIDGFITSRRLMAGEFVNTGAPIATVVDVHLLKANLYVPESKVFALRPGQKATITADAVPTTTFTGVIAYVSPQGDDNHNYLVQVSIQNAGSRLKAGQFVLAAFHSSGTYQALQIPQSALTGSIKKPYVFVADSGKARLREVVAGRASEGRVEILGGLRQGELVITSGQINLVNGSNITVFN